MSESAGGDGVKPITMGDLESGGMVSVYCDGQFVWQLPKVLLSKRVPTVKLKTLPNDTNGHSIDEHAVEAPYIWEITCCSRAAFRVFYEWLYSPDGRLKRPSPEVTINAYLQATKLASEYSIPNLLEDSMKIALDLLSAGSSENSPSYVSEIYKNMSPKSPETATTSGYFAVLLKTSKLASTTFRNLTASLQISRDILIWLFLFNENEVDGDDYNKALGWATSNVAKWIEFQE
ncbi:hypothetical protein BGW36DRAFT_442299 [Talaromyces proteolyticus]|uniref:BTB domain-containing protein n=1 Tax=Talaromyces proteolyticus TaxID=1131652 RepID=A0AAD4PUB1_9EURO|nr:uncharacterized protein BGW36DRAFT_442299 [Talaromyces proteolyticus]KAH8689103.1 hypothetical protein BGW36DRAFT_442299 [Talaromyces proteolyticus]